MSQNNNLALDEEYFVVIEFLLHQTTFKLDWCALDSNNAFGKHKDVKDANVFQNISAKLLFFKIFFSKKTCFEKMVVNRV